KLIGSLESPKRGVFLLTALGRDLLALPERDGALRARELDKEFRRNRPQRRRAPDGTNDPGESIEGSPEFEPELTGSEQEDDDPTAGSDWRDQLISRLHALPADGFEDFVILLLRMYGLELERVGRSGDRGIDGIG